MAVFVLVHGAYTGGWIWATVATALRRNGHLVYHPTLEGCAERAAALRPGITLNTQAKELAQLFHFEDLRDVVLVATSAGGLVAARAAEEARDRIQRLIFVDALLPISGETVAQINGRTRSNANGLEYGPGADKAFLDIVPDKLRAWAQARYTHHPRAPLEEPVDLAVFWARRWRAHVLRCSGASRPPESHHRRSATLLNATYDELDAGHYPMLTHANELSQYLQDCVARD